MLEKYFSAPKTLRRLRGGISGPHIDTFADDLEREGYAPASAVRYLRAAAHLGCFVQRKSGVLADIDLNTLASFSQHLRRCRPAGVIGDGLMPALWTGIEVSTQSRSAAILDGAESLELLIIETRFVSVQKATALCAEDVGHLHGRPAHSCFLDLTPVLLSFTSESWSFASGLAALCRCSCER